MIAERNSQHNYVNLILLCFVFIFSSCLVTKEFNRISRSKSITGKTFIYGKVVDNHGIPLPGAIVQSSNLMNRIQTDSNGRYLLELTDKSREIRASWIGYLPFQSKGIKLKSGDSVQFNFTMTENKEEIID